MSWTCEQTGKIPHMSPEAANKTALKAMQRKPVKEDALGFQSYLCEHCKGWHWGHSFPKVEK